MNFFWHSILICLLFNTCVFGSENIDPNAHKSTERDESAGTQQNYESKTYSSHPVPQSSLVLNNGYNNPLAINRETNSPHIYGSGHQSEDHLDRKERKTLILAIPVKLSLPNVNQMDSSYDPKATAETSNSKSQSLPYLSSYSSLNTQPISDEQNSDDSLSEKRPQLPPLSHKIYSSLESQLKALSYSKPNGLPSKALNEQSGLGYSNDYKYIPIDDNKDQMESQYMRNLNQFRLSAPKGESYYRGVESDFGSDKYKSNKSSHLIYEDSYEARLKQREKSKLLYNSMPENKPEYDYDSNSDTEDDVRAEDIKDYDIKNTPYLRYNVKNEDNGKGFAAKPDIITQYYYNQKGNGQQLPVFMPQPFDGWPNYYYKPIKNWPQIQDSFDGNLMNLMNGYKNKQNVKNSLYGQAFDLLADSQPKAASNPIPFALKNSKIYGASAHYQPLSLFAGYGRDYSLLDMNGDLYPAPLVASTPPRKLHKPLKYNEFGEQGSRDSIKSPPRNPLLLRPTFMSGLRSVTSKPLANYSPLTSASTTYSLLSSLPTSFNINKSIPRQIFPLFYG